VFIYTNFCYFRAERKFIKRANLFNCLFWEICVNF